MYEYVVYKEELGYMKILRRLNKVDMGFFLFKEKEFGFDEIIEKE